MELKFFIFFISVVTELKGWRCSMPELKNGSIKMRQRGRLIRFQCKATYQLYGNQYAGCVGYKWDSPIPICAKSGCELPAQRENGFLSLHGGQATFFCKQDYQVSGNRISYCDGKKWDREIGICKATNKTVLRTCDFEVEDLCGWTHDVGHDFEWQRVLGVDNLRRLRTGPQHDHTTMKPYGGHYMLIEAVNQLPGNRARLISPVYPPEYSRDACFRFFYHMYGPSVDTLRVYIKPISIDFEVMLEEDKYLFFELKGNQKNMWKETIFDIDQSVEPFQIIFEGLAGKTQLSDIAIDDVALMQYAECTNGELGFKEVVTEEIDGVYDVKSCKDRCNETEPSAGPKYERITNGTGKDGLIMNCDCHDQCMDIMTCCPDYKSVCSMIEYATLSTIPVSKTSIAPVSNPIGSTTASTLRQSSSTTSSTLQYSGPSTSVITTNTRIMATSTSTIPTSKTTTTSTTKAISTINTTARPKDEGIYTISENGFEGTVQSNKATDSWAGTTTLVYSKPFNNNDIKQNDSELQTTETIKNNTKANLWQASIKQFDYTDSTRPVPITIIGLIVGLICALILIAFFVRYYRRRFGPENYKKNSEGLIGNTNEEFSEIRFLTSDEQLDFTLQTSETARPSDI